MDVEGNFFGVCFLMLVIEVVGVFVVVFGCERVVFVGDRFFVGFVLVVGVEDFEIG